MSHALRRRLTSLALLLLKKEKHLVLFIVVLKVLNSEIIELEINVQGVLNDG
jgi:hypothetical protein